MCCFSSWVLCYKLKLSGSKLMLSHTQHRFRISFNRLFNPVCIAGASTHKSSGGALSTAMQILKGQYAARCHQGDDSDGDANSASTAEMPKTLSRYYWNLRAAFIWSMEMPCTIAVVLPPGYIGRRAIQWTSQMLYPRVDWKASYLDGCWSLIDWWTESIWTYLEMLLWSSNWLDDVVCRPVRAECRTLPRIWNGLLQNSEFYDRRQAVDTFNANNIWRKRGISINPCRWGFTTSHPRSYLNNNQHTICGSATRLTYWCGHSVLLATKLAMLTQMKVSTCFLLGSAFKLHSCDSLRRNSDLKEGR